jgi:hypothetical protein
MWGSLLLVGKQYWFPLVLLGFGLLGLLGWDSVGDDFGWFAYAPPASAHGFIVTQDLSGLSSTSVTFVTGPYPTRDPLWAVLAAAAVVITAAWYGWRARQAGEPVRPYVTWAVGGGLAVLACHAVAAMAGALSDSGLVTSAGLPLVVFGTLTWVLSRGERWRVPAMVCVALGAAIVLGAWVPGLLDPVIIAVGLFALARFERSRLLAIVAAAALVAMTVFATGTLSMLVPAGIVLAAGIVVLGTWSMSREGRSGR